MARYVDNPDPTTLRMVAERYCPNVGMALILKDTPAEMTKGGIFIPEISQDVPSIGTILSLNLSDIDDPDMDWAEGQRVLLPNEMGIMVSPGIFGMEGEGSDRTPIFNVDPRRLVSVELAGILGIVYPADMQPQLADA